MVYSQEDADVGGENGGLLQHNLPVSNEVAVRAVIWNEHVEPLPDKPVLVALKSTAVDPEVEPHVEEAAISLLDSDVAQQPASTRGRFFRPGQAGGRATDPATQAHHVVVDVRAFAAACDLVGSFPVGSGVARRHPVVRVLGE